MHWDIDRSMHRPAGVPAYRIASLSTRRRSTPVAWVDRSIQRASPVGGPASGCGPKLVGRLCRGIGRSVGKSIDRLNESRIQWLIHRSVHRRTDASVHRLVWTLDWRARRLVVSSPRHLIDLCTIGSYIYNQERAIQNTTISRQCPNRRCCRAGRRPPAAATAVGPLKGEHWPRRARRASLKI